MPRITPVSFRSRKLTIGHCLARTMVCWSEDCLRRADVRRLAAVPCPQATIALVDLAPALVMLMVLRFHLRACACACMIPLQWKQGPKRTGSELPCGMTRGACHRLVKHTISSALNKGHAQVPHVEARVETRVGAAHLPSVHALQIKSRVIQKVHIEP